MIEPKNGVPAQTFTLRNSSGKDVRFTGWKLAEVDSFNPDAVDKFTGHRTGSARWKERAVYQTEGGSYVCHRLGRSKVSGEVDRGEVLVAASEQEIADFFSGDQLAKDLLDDLGIADVDEIA